MRWKSLLLGLVLCVSAAPVSAASIDYTDILGNQWRDLNDTTNLSWNQVATVCPADGITPCAGTVGSTDFTGWIWASRGQVRTVIKEITGLTTELDDVANPPQAIAYVQANSTWAPLALAAFNPTEQIAGFRLVHGWTSTDVGFGILWLISDAPPGLEDVVRTNIGDKNIGSPDVGTWLYRPEAVPVPEPTTITLLTLGGLAASASRRWRKR